MSRVRVVVGVLVLFFVVTAVAIFLFGPTNGTYVQTKFDSAQWKSHLESQDSIKQSMVSDLLESYQLVGKSSQEIEDLLGKPPSSNYFKDYEYVYWLGPERGPFGLDSEWLCIKFSKGKVVAADILTD